MRVDQLLFLIERYRELFWPKFYEHDGCVFTIENPVHYRQWFEKCGGDRARIEATMNHRHILDVFPHPVDDPTSEFFITVGRLLREAWETKLRRDFPDREFVVSFPEADAALDDYEITFWQQHEKT